MAYVGQAKACPVVKNEKCRYCNDDYDCSILMLILPFEVTVTCLVPIKILSQKPDDNLVAQLLRKKAALGWFHPPKVPDLLGYLAKVLI
jgi:hypothetical protein